MHSSRAVCSWVNRHVRILVHGLAADLDKLENTGTPIVLLWQARIGRGPTLARKCDSAGTSSTIGSGCCEAPPVATCTPHTACVAGHPKT